MNRDLSVSKTGQATAYDNHNIRILARDNDTLLSVTNERGNAQISLTGTITGKLIGWNVLNNHVILFTTTTTVNASTGVATYGTDYIYRIDYDPTAASNQFTDTLLYSAAATASSAEAGCLGFRPDHPIESVVYYETEDIQKIYWVDGLHVLRMMNFMTDATGRTRWDSDYFDTHRGVSYSLTVDIKKDNSGNARPNGVVQYVITYYNRHGQETGYVWTSDLVYLSPNKRGGAADETNNNKVTLKISGIENKTGTTTPRYTNIRIYSIFRSAYKGTPVGYIVADVDTSVATNGEIIVIDDGAHLETTDASRLLFLGSRDAKIGTLAYKEQTLFLGDIVLNENSTLTIESAIKANMFILSNGSSFRDGYDWEAKTSTSGSVGIEFIRSSGTSGDTRSFGFEDTDEVYSYSNQLALTSSNIMSFKGGEKYRFGLLFRKPSGENSEVFWIGDKVNHIYPLIDNDNDRINRIVAKCVISSAVITAAMAAGYTAVQLMYAEATYADRSVKAQGVLNPTMFNVWERFNGRIYSMPSWTSRPRNAKYASKHFEVVHNSNDSSGEIECNYWETKTTPVPYYQLADYGTANERYIDEESGVTSANYGMLIFKIRDLSLSTTVEACGILATTTSGFIDPILDIEFADSDFPSNGETKTKTITGGSIAITKTNHITTTYSKTDDNLRWLYTRITNYINESLPELVQFIPPEQVFYAWCRAVANNSSRYWSTQFPDTDISNTSYYGAANNNPSNDPTARWITLSEGTQSNSIAYNPSYNKKHLMFVDENVVTLDSPEISYETTSLDNVDGCKLRVVGVAPVTGRISDVQINATQGDFVGENLVNDKFSGAASSEDLTGILAWPLWKENGLGLKDVDESSKDIKKRTAEDYTKGSNVVNYWMYLWSKSDVIDGYTDEDTTVFDEDAYSRIRRKVFGNLRFAKNTIYNDTWSNMWVASDVHPRIFNYTSSQYVGIQVGDKTTYYDGYIDEILSVPANFTYPIWYSYGAYDDGLDKGTTAMKLYTKSPVRITYGSNPHAVLSLGSSITDGKYVQKLLPYFSADDIPAIPQKDTNISGSMVPWIEQDENIIYAHWQSAYPGSFSVTELADGTVTIYAYYDTASTNFVDNFWNRAKGTYPDVPIYVRVTNATSTYLVDITTGGESITQSYTDEGYVNYYVRGMQVKEKYTSGASIELFVDVLYITTAGAITESGTKELNLTTGILYDASSANYPYTDYDVVHDSSGVMTFNSASTTEFDRTKPYFLIGELYYDFDAAAALNPLSDTRYGGITKSAVQNCKFIPAGPIYKMVSGNFTVYGNQGDTYFQRWDDLRIKPAKGEMPNNVVDIVSVMLETHINLDGRTDNQRGTRYLASIDVEQFGVLNRVYSQPNDFYSGRDLDRDYDLDSYRSTLTWTLDKADAADIDEWTHVTLSNTLKLNGDKGICNALRRYRNAIIAFQDRCLSEILFNSRVQISASDGVPIEIANSGKVDGKQTISDKHGCVNKWSVVEGKTGLYFVDNVNKIFASFDGSGVNNISDQKGFGVWFKNRNNMKPWTPAQFNNLVAYYDRIHSDIYLVGATDSTTGQSCLVYSEPLQEFTSFFDYGNVPMMANVSDRLISAYPSGNNTVLWLQNEGNRYCKFFGTQYNFWTEHRVAPDMFMDKIWTGLEYRADFYRIGGENSVTESNFDTETYYQPTETFDKFKAWNEYQSTSETTIPQAPADAYPDVRKKFRIWRLDMPRAAKDNTYNKNGLNRMRNPWLQFRLTRTLVGNDNKAKDLMQLHDIIVNYFE